ncbi:MAG: sugar transferase [Pseudomonadales bacterium]|nr:sugar transferase [Pseudomonadales bacterium]
MNIWQRWAKRSFDIILSMMGLLLISWLIAILWLIAAIDTRQSGFFKQRRIGIDGRPFFIYKIRTMRNVDGVTTVVTQKGDARITAVGGLLRNFKLDELPQLFNVLRGDMSFVGPRPEVQEYADILKREKKSILTVRPGITGPASIFFFDEEELLADKNDPESYSRDVIFPIKIRINQEYINSYSLLRDLEYIFSTVIPQFRTGLRASIKRDFSL